MRGSGRRECGRKQEPGLRVGQEQALRSTGARAGLSAWLLRNFTEVETGHGSHGAAEGGVCLAA